MALIEQHQEVSYERNIADVRSWDQKYAEKLSAPEFFAMQAAVLVGLMVLVKVLLLVWIVAFAILLSIHLNYRVILPLRYPPDARDAKGKAGDGIMLFGSLRSKNPYENFREIWMADADLRTHFLILGSTGSGKSETLKGMFYNALCWGSGFFLADGKADNKMPTDLMSMCRMTGADDDFLALNFLIGGSSPEKIRASRRRRTNMINTFSDSDADTQIQMGANLLPKAEGEGKSWQEKALNFWRSLVVALCYKRDTQGFEISVGIYIDYMGLPKVEELYAEGYREYILNGEWSYGFVGIKSYCESGGCPGFMVDRVLAKFNLPPDPASASRTGLPNGGPGGRAGVGAMPAQAGKPAQKVDQDQATYDQHGYRIGQLMPALNLLDKTYGHIFRAKYSEIDMVDIALNNRVLVMMIPSLEKSASEAENLGKLAIACLRVMMGRNLGADIEGHRSSVLESKATEANYPFLVALDELGYYFSDGVAIMFAQARSLGMSMLAAAQDLEKLTEGSRQAEAGAMLANAVGKFFMRIDDAQKTWNLIADYVGKARVAVYDSYELGMGGFNRDKAVRVEQVERVTLEDMQKLGAGQGILNTRGKTMGVNSFYVGSYLEEHKQQEFRLCRFLQVRPVSVEEVLAYSIPADALRDDITRGKHLLDILTYRASPSLKTGPSMVLGRLEMVASKLPRNVAGAERGAALYIAAKKAIDEMFAAPHAKGVVNVGSGKRINDTGVGETAVPHGIGEGTTAGRVAGMDGFGVNGLSAGGDLSGFSGLDELVDMPTAADITGNAATRRTGSGNAVDPASLLGQEEPTGPADEADLDPLAYLMVDPILERRPVAQVLAPVSARPARAPVPASPPPAPPSVPSAARTVTGFGRTGPNTPQTAADARSPDTAGADEVDAFLSGTFEATLGAGTAGTSGIGGLVATSEAPLDARSLFKDLDSMAEESPPLLAPIAVAPTPAATRSGFGSQVDTHAVHGLDDPSGKKRISASGLRPPNVLSLRAQTSIAAVVQVGRALRPRPIFARSENQTVNNGRIPSKSAAGDGFKPNDGQGGSATLGQSEDWVASALDNAELTLRKVGPDAIGFDDVTRASVARVEAALGATDPVTAALNTERIVAAAVTPADTSVEVSAVEAEDSIADVMSLLG